MIGLPRFLPRRPGMVGDGTPTLAVIAGRSLFQEGVALLVGPEYPDDRHAAFPSGTGAVSLPQEAVRARPSVVSRSARPDGTAECPTRSTLAWDC